MSIVTCLHKVFPFLTGFCLPNKYQWLAIQKLMRTHHFKLVITPGNTTEVTIFLTDPCYSLWVAVFSFLICILGPRNFLKQKISIQRKPEIKLIYL